MMSQVNNSNSKLSDYEVISVIGTGSHGTCFKVKNKITNKIFVWKSIDYNHVSEEKAEEILTEINLLRELKHPNIVRYYDHIIHRETKTLYIIMECCDGGDLGKLIEKCKMENCYFEEKFIWQALYQISKALQGCHSGDSKITILHRDIKPANVFLDSNGNVKLGDFGLARVLHGSNSFAETIVGTPYYMSPEVIKGKKYNRKSDIWSLGCLIYEMCALDPPFKGLKFEQLFSKINEGQFNRIPKIYSDDLNKIIAFMLSVDHGYRPTIEVILHHPTVISNLNTSTGPPKLIKSSTDNSNTIYSSTIINQDSFLKSTPELRQELFASARRRIFGTEMTTEKNNNKIVRAISDNSNINPEPNKISQEIFGEALKQRMHAIRAKESLLQQKEDELKVKERELLKRERKITNRPSNKSHRRTIHEINESFTTIEPNDSIVIPTVAKFNPKLVPRPKNLPTKVTFKSPLKPSYHNRENIPPQKHYNHQDLENAVTKNFTNLNINNSKKSHKRRSIFSIFSSNNSNQRNLEIQSTKTIKSTTSSSGASSSAQSELTSKWNSATKKTAFEMLALLNATENGNGSGAVRNGKEIFMIDDKIIQRDRKRKSMIVYRKNTVL